MSGTPVSVIEEEDEDVTTTSASLTSEMSKTSLQTAVQKPGHDPNRRHGDCPGDPVDGGSDNNDGFNLGDHPGTSKTISTDQDTTITGASSDLPMDEDPSSGSTEVADGDNVLDPHDFMTSSYTEISFGSDDPDSDRDLITETDDQFGDKELNQPSVLTTNLVQEMASSIVSWSEKAAADYNVDNVGSTSVLGPLLITDERPPTREWTESSEEAREVVSFVSDDLERHLKLSSPNHGVNHSSESRSSTIVSDATDLQADDEVDVSSVLDPDVDVAIDYHVLNQIETQIIHMNNSVNAMMSMINHSTHSLSKLTVDCVDSYQNCLYKTCDAVDGNIKSMYQLMAQVEELNRSMKSVHDLHVQLNSVRHLLDIFEKKIGF